MGKKKHTFEFVKEQIEKEGYKLLSKEYKNNHSKLKVKCDKYHEYLVSWNSFSQGHRCKKCYAKKTSKRQKLTYEFVKEQIEKEGYELLSEKYKNSKTKLKIKCDKGHEYQVKWNYFQQGKRCRICYNEKRNNENHPNWKGWYSFENIPLFNTYAHQIDYCEEVRRNPEDENILQVKCTYCGKWYTPTVKEICNRIYSLNIKGRGEARLYCSPECKKECPIFWKHLYQEDHPNKPDNYRPYQTEWYKMVIEKDNYTCQICEATEDLVAHHIKPVKTHPHLQADVDNGICLCKKCHDKHGHKDECSKGNLGKLCK